MKLSVKRDCSPVAKVLACLAWLVCALGGAIPRLPAQSPTLGPPQASEPEDDPRPGLKAYFAAIGRGDKPAALARWDDDQTGQDDHRKYVAELVPFVVNEAIAQAKIKRVVASKLPEVYRQLEMADNGDPAPARLAAARFTRFRRLAIVRWGDAPDEALPMVYDNHDREHGVWKISMQQWHETVGSSVGDSLLRADLGAKTAELLIRDMAAGKIRSAEDYQRAAILDMREALEPQAALRDLSDAAPALRNYAKDHGGLLPRSLDELGTYSILEPAVTKRLRLLKPGLNPDKLPPDTIILEAIDAAGRVGQLRADGESAMKKP